MNIRKKILGTICATTVCLIVIFAAATSLVIQQNFDQLERETVIDSLERVQATLNDQILALDTLTHDWANWDDTYTFVNDHNEEYIASNIVEDTFTTSADIDVLLIINTAGDLVHGVFFNKQENRMEPPDAELFSSLAAHEQLLKPIELDDGKNGIIQFKNRYLVIAARPILNSNGEGPSHGTIMMGRILDKERITHLQKITRTSANFYPLRRAIIPPGAINAAQELLASHIPHYITVFSEDIIQGYKLLNDVSGNAVLLLALDVKRDIHHQSHNTLNFLLYSIVFIGIVFGLIIFFLIDLLVLGRLSALTTDIVQIEKNTARCLRVREFSSNDELGKLSLSINHMMDAIESLEKYKIKSEKLEVLATFAAGATHEFATPLSTIAIASGEILHDFEVQGSAEGELYEDILLIRDQVNRCKDILYQMAADAGEHMGEVVESISTRELIDATLARFDKTTLKQIKIDNTIPDQIITMPVRSLRRVLRGILKNSVNASKAEESISLSCCENDTHLLFKIRDRGEGMDEYTLQHAADPFFTTKSPGNGMGLGLYLAQSLALRFAGTLHLKSTPAAGTTVILSFAKEKIYV
jgi:sensor domain CHASE-containing protein/nitrogen-specific signal transduction histidine kinase